MILVKHQDRGQLVPYFYWGMEFYILEHLLKEDEVYFSTWPIYGTIIGKNQVIENEVNLDYTKKHHIPVYRRPSGGGTVYADERNMMFTIAKKRNLNFSFQEELNQIVNCLNQFGIPAVFSGRNDITIEGKKISGNSFIQNKHGMIIHGTLLFDTDLEIMIRAITPSNEKLISKGIESIRSRVTNIKPYANGKSLEELRTFIEEHLTDQVYALTEEEMRKIEVMGQKYADPKWIFQEQPLHTKKVKERTSAGVIELHLDVSYGTLKSMRITGDFFEKKAIAEFEKAFVNIEFSKEIISKILRSHPIEDYIVNLDTETIQSLLFKTILSE